MKLLAIVVAACAALTSLGAVAQEYPTRPIRWVVNYPPGGTTDVVARGVAQGVAENLGVTIVVENKAGAGGLIGMDTVAKATPDGYTFLVSDASLATAPSLYKSMPFDPLKDLQAVALFVTVPHVIVVTPGLPVRSVDELVALSKKEPGRLNFSSGGVGSPLHLAGEVFRAATGVTWTHVPYKGASPAIMAAVSGEADVAAPSAPAALAQIAGGRLRALAVTSDRRMTQLPGVPTLAELGQPKASVFGWVGLHAPAGTPPAAMSRMQAAVMQALKAPALQARLQEQGSDVVAQDGDAYGTMVGIELARWKQVVQSAGITPE
jgi:tripartite-type tricarboxylate transporter receptor subunit TctC